MEHGKPTILVVEDQDDIREMIVELASDDGFAVLTAANGQEALTLLRQHPHVRVIVLDLVMPVMNGATFRGAQLEDPAIAHIPIVMLTARDDSSTLASALAAEACLQKPFTSADLLAILARYR